MPVTEEKYSFAATPLPGAIQLSLVQQAMVVILGSLIMDGGNLLRACLYGIGAYWIGVALIWFRRGAAVTKVDVFSGALGRSDSLRRFLLCDRFGLVSARARRFILK